MRDISIPNHFNLDTRSNTTTRKQKRTRNHSTQNKNKKISKIFYSNMSGKGSRSETVPYEESSEGSKKEGTGKEGKMENDRI